MTTPLSAADLRSRDDRALYDSLLEHRLVKRVNERIAKLEEDNPYSIRRRLLATSVRLSERMAPDLHRMANECIEMLRLDTPLELYAFASPQFNAMCFKPEDGRLYVMFASSLLEAFDENELKFVVGHELGHHVYRHHDVPIGVLLDGKSGADPRLALSLFTWSRYAEISADRAGAHCADDIEAVSRSLFKLASGLSSERIQFSLDDFLKQFEEMQGLSNDISTLQKGPQQDWFSTHPFSPLRVKALQLFDRSVLARAEGTSVENLEIGVQGLMSLMEPSYMEGRTEIAESMRRLLFAAALVVANADGDISEEEIAVFQKFFGKTAYSETINLDSIAAELPGRLEAVRSQASIAQRMQVLRDLCLVARAEGHAHNHARSKLYEIASALDVPEAFIEQSLCSSLTPD